VFTCGFTPLPNKVCTISAGVAKISFLGFLIASTVNRWDFEVFALKGLDYRTANAITGLSLAGLARAVAWVGMQFLSHPLSRIAAIVSAHCKPLTIYRKDTKMMAREIRSLVVVALFAFLALPGPAFAFSGVGTGTEINPYIITNVEELQQMKTNLDAYYELGNDVDASETYTWNEGRGFGPVGNHPSPFTGVFDGQGHRIKALHINRPSDTGVGLFGYTSDAEISRIGLIDADVYGNYFVGSLVGGCRDGSVVSNCYAAGQVTISASGSSDAKSGGLVGACGRSTISQCYSAVNVTALSSRYQIGGLCGYLRALAGDPPALIINCYSAGTVTSNGWKVGGLLGDADGRNAKVSMCYSVAKVTGTHKKGLVGFNFRSPTIEDSYWDKEASTCSSSRGGAGKTAEEMMQQATFANWDFVNVWDLLENESYPSLLKEVDSGMAVVNNIEHLIREKVEQWKKIDVLLRKEQRAYRALDEMLRSGDYGNLGYSGIVTAREEIYSVIQQDEQLKQAMEYSIERLESALVALGFELVPEASD